MYTKEEKKQLNTDFWNGFAEYYSKIPRLSRKKGMPFMLYNTRMKGVELKYDIRRDGVDVVLEVNGWKRKNIYNDILTYKILIEEQFEKMRPLPMGDGGVNPLVYDDNYVRESGEEVCRIYSRISGLDFHKKECWPVFYEFMVWRMLAMERAFKQIRDALSDSFFDEARYCLI